MTTRLLSIVLQREDSNVPWGFRLTGGGDKVTSPPVSILRVCPGTLASRHLVPGDILLAVHDRSTRGLTAAQVDEIVSSAGNSLQLLIQEAGGEVNVGSQAPRAGLEATLDIPGPTVYVTCEDGTGGPGATITPEIHVSAGACPDPYDMSGGIRVYPQMYTAVETRGGGGGRREPLSPSGSEDTLSSRGQGHSSRVHVIGSPSPQVVSSPQQQHPPFAIKVTMTMMPVEYEEVVEEDEEEERVAAAAGAGAGEGKRLPRSIWSYDDMEAAAAQEAMAQGPRQDR